MTPGDEAKSGLLTFEGYVEHGQVRLRAPIRLPEKTKVYVLVPDLRIELAGRVVSPRLADARQRDDFKL